MKKAKPFLPSVQQKLACQRGASLLEGIAYLGIAALVVLGAVSLLTGAFGSAKANQTTEEVVALRTAVRKLYAGQPYNDNAMTANLITARAIPNTLVVTAGVVNNGWGGTVTFAGPTPTTFTIAYTLMPQDVCMNVVSGANGWTQIAGTGAATITVFTAANAATVCANATNTVTFTAT